MVSRRETLRIGSSVLVLGLAGCLGNPSTGSPDSPSPERPPTASPEPFDPTASPEPFDPLDYVDEWHEQPVQAKGEPIEIEPAESSEPLDVACKSLASLVTDTVRNRVDERLEDEGRLSGAYGLIDHPDFETAVKIHRQFIIEQDGTVASRPKVSFDKLLEVTPRTIQATVRYEDETHSCEFPVFLEDQVAYLEG